MRAFRCQRPFWFRPSAIAAGFVLAQILEQRYRTGGWIGVHGVEVTAAIFAVAIAATVPLTAIWTWAEKQRRFGR